LAKLNFFESLSKPALKGLTIAASTVAVVELLKQDYSVGISASLSWLLLLIVSNRLYK
jgi:Na+-translocating ferredoxin:NAD+ oxidoreductase RnfE subunit|tara:strand:+ start:189 stop:362 length:174 start_codon:yes stop_codon:yes gene_type:complete